MTPPSRRSVLRSLCAAAVVGLAGCSSSCPDEDAPAPETVVRADDGPAGPFESTPSGTWPAPRYDPGNAGYGAATPPGSRVGIRWTTRVATPEDGSASSPVVADGAVFVAEPGGVHAVNLRDGTDRWHHDEVRPAEVPSTFDYEDETVPPVVAPDGSVLVGGRDALSALDPTDGTVRWTYEEPSPFSIPVATGDAVYATTGNRAVALDPADGTELWTATVDLERTNLPAVGDGAVVVADGSRTVAIERSTGEDRWSAEGGVEDYPVVAGGDVYLGGYDGLRARSLSDGGKRWTFERGSGRSMTSPVVAPDALYVVEQPGEAPAATFALNRTDGEPSPRWCSYIADGAVTGAAGDQAFVLRTSVESGPSLVAFADRFGEATWGYATADDLLPPAILDGGVVLADRRGTVVAVGEV